MDKTNALTAGAIAGIRELLPLAPLSEQSFVQMKDILMEVGLSNPKTCRSLHNAHTATDIFPCCEIRCLGRRP